MIRSLLLLALVPLTGACEGRRQSEFHLLRNTAEHAQLVDLTNVSRSGKGIARVTLISVKEQAFTTSNGKSARYGHFRFAFDCSGRRYRGEGVTIFGPDFRKVDEVRGRSRWWPITEDRGLAEDFRRFCASPPNREDLTALAGGSWEEAAMAAVGRIKRDRRT